MSKVNINEMIGEIGSKFDNTGYVDGMQHAPDAEITTNFVQEYTVIIRKKKYYAITALEGNEKYDRVYQINNFSSINTSIQVSGSPGSCAITIVGNTKIICAERDQQDKHSWSSFNDMLTNWSYNHDDNTTKMDSNGNYQINNSLFDNADDMKKIKYGWKVAEKCDFEPMDEVYIFGKSRREKEGDKYKMYQIFFGYVGDVKKSYTAGASNPLISITAADHLKLLQYSYIANTPAVNYQTSLAGAHYSKDVAGNLIIDDNPLGGTNGETKASPFTNIFAGQYPYEIVYQCAEAAGVPEHYLKKRIEKIKRIPFMPMLKNQMVELFQSDLATRLSFCQKAAEDLFVEFFADEEGNIVLKIPNYTLGVNEMAANNAYIDSYMSATDKEAAKNAGIKEKTYQKEVITYETVTETLSKTITHTVVKGDTLWDISKKYLGNATRWPEIYNLNKSKIKDPHWIYPGQVFTIKAGETVTKQVEKKVYQTVTEKVDGGPISTVTDKYIPAIRDDEIISFVLSDSDGQIINAVQIKQETPLFDLASTGGEMGAIRAVQDWGSIIRFGMRIGKTTSTPLLDNEIGPAMFGSLLIQRSLSQRYTGTLTMIEDSSIRVGNPIRVFLYDEHPFKFDNAYSRYGRAQAIFYVTKIDRSIKAEGVSIMTLSLTAGRVMGMSSIYDKMSVLYSRYFEEYDLNLSDSVIQQYEDAFNSQNGSNNDDNGGDSGDSGGSSDSGNSGGTNISRRQLEIITYAKSFIGVPYVWGNMRPL